MGCTVILREGLGSVEGVTQRSSHWQGLRPEVQAPLPWGWCAGLQPPALHGCFLKVLEVLLPPIEPGFPFPDSLVDVNGQALPAGAGINKHI